MASESRQSTHPSGTASLLDQARRKLQAPAAAADNPLPALAAAAFLALAGLGFVAVSVLAPPTRVTPAYKSGVR